MAWSDFSAKRIPWLLFLCLHASKAEASISLKHTNRDRFKDCRGFRLSYIPWFFITAPSRYIYEVHLEFICRLSCMIGPHVSLTFFAVKSSEIYTRTRLQQRCMMICLNDSQLFWKKNFRHDFLCTRRWIMFSVSYVAFSTCRLDDVHVPCIIPVAAEIIDVLV